MKDEHRYASLTIGKLHLCLCPKGKQFRQTRQNWNRKVTSERLTKRKCRLWQKNQEHNRWTKIPWSTIDNILSGINSWKCNRVLLKPCSNVCRRYARTDFNCNIELLLSDVHSLNTHWEIHRTSEETDTPFSLQFNWPQMVVWNELGNSGYVSSRVLWIIQGYHLFTLVTK